MQIKEFEELQKSIDNKSFETKYSPLDKLMHFSSYLGNLASIFFAYWFLNRLIYRATSDFFGRDVLIIISTVVVLSLFEMIKRYVLKIFSLAAIMSKKLNTETLYTLVFSLILLSGSFYLSLSGAKIFADKRETIKMELTTNMDTQIDSVKAIYDGQLKYRLENRDQIRKNREVITNKMAQVGDNTTRLREFTKMMADESKELQRVDSTITALKAEQQKTIDEIKTETKITSEDKVDEVSKNQVAFLLISTFIELFILVGIWFHCWFKLKVYQEFKNNLVNSQQYGMYKDYLKLLYLLYQNGKLELETELPAMTNFTTTAKKRLDFQASYSKEFIQICKTLEILTLNNHRRHIISKKYQDAKDLMIDYFNEE